MKQNCDFDRGLAQYKHATLPLNFLGINRAWERNPYIMYPMKIQNREFFGLNMKFSMCRDYTKNFSKIAPPGKGEK